MTTAFLRRAAAILFVLIGVAACRDRTPTDVEMQIRSIGVDHSSGSPVVLLQNKDRSLSLPIWIGLVEAQAIALEMEGITPPRPMTHDLMKTILEQAGVGFDKVTIVEVRESTYFARLHLEANGKSFEIDSRPSDALALAVRFHRPIFVSASLLGDERGVDLRGLAAEGGEGQGVRTARGVTVQNLSADLAEYFAVGRGSGVLVSAVDLEVAGLRRGDLVVAINGDEVGSAAEFAETLDSLADAPAILSVVRGHERIAVPLPNRFAGR